MNALTEGHYRSQIAVRAALLRRLSGVWPMFDPARIDESWPAVQRALTALVWLGHRQSSDIAAGYYGALRVSQGLDGVAPVVKAPAPSIEYLDRVFTYVGLIVPKKLVAAGRRDVSSQTLVHVAGTVGRLALNGGRDTLTASIRSDQRARGYRRVTGGRACSFCSMLADRGAVYGADSADFAAHDHCSCSAEPVFA